MKRSLFGHLRSKTMKKELLNQIYDKLMDNSWEDFDNFDVNEVENQEVDLDYSVISFNYNGKKVVLEVSIK